MKRLHLVVEGHGDVAAAPQLAWEVLRHVGRTGWLVNQRASRLPRSQIVDESMPSPGRLPARQGLAAAVAMAAAARAHALLVLVDADDDCAAAFGPAASAELIESVPAAAVMAVREYEAWLLGARSTAELRRVGVRDLEGVRDAKGKLKRMIPGYKPTTHQVALSKGIDVAALRTRSPSFDKFCREIERLTR